MNSIEFGISDQWDGGFRASVSVTNNNQNSLEGWTIEFEAPFEITQIWNAEIVRQEGNRYTLRNVEWNSQIAAGETASFGFVGSGDNPAAPDDLTLNGQLTETSSGPAPLNPPPPVDSAPADSIPVDPASADSIPVDPAPVDSTSNISSNLSSTGELALGETYEGRGTFYDATGEGNSGYDVVPESGRDRITAINREQWDNSEASGAFLRVSGPRQRAGIADPITVMVVDQLPDRADGLDLSEGAFADVADPVDGIVGLDYELVSPEDSFVTPYGNQIGDGIIVDRLAESNPYWTAVRLTNHRHPVESLALVTETGEQVSFERQSHNIFVLEQGAIGPIRGEQDFLATDVFGQTVSLNNLDLTSGTGADVVSGEQFARVDL